jgi:hypothetical protein
MGSAPYAWIPILEASDSLQLLINLIKDEVIGYDEGFRYHYPISIK